MYADTNLTEANGAVIYGYLEVTIVSDSMVLTNSVNELMADTLQCALSWEVNNTVDLLVNWSQHLGSNSLHGSSNTIGSEES